MDTLRLSDTDREAAVALLGEQYAVGRLTKDEFDERSDAVWSAKTRSDLAPVFVDLPTQAPVRIGRGPSSPSSPSRRFAFPLAPVLFVLVALAVVTHIPFVLLGLLAWFVLSRGCGAMRPPWSGHRPRMR